jgi:hypothetical protein
LVIVGREEVNESGELAELKRMVVENPHHDHLPTSFERFRYELNRTKSKFERYGLWLLKNSCFVKIAGIWEIENVYQNGDRRLENS